MFSSSAKQILYILLGPLICLVVANFPAPEGMTQPGMLNLGACLWIVLWWMTEVFPMTVTSIISIPVFAILGLLTPARAFSFFGSPAVMLIFGATIIVGVLKESNFMIRYAHYVMSLKFIQGSKTRLFILFALSTGLLSCIAPNIPLVIIFVYIVVTMAKSCNVDAGNNIARGLTVLACAAPNIGGFGTLLGGVPNLVVIAIVAKITQHEVTFWEWASLGMPICLIGLIIIAIMAILYFRGGDASAMMDNKFLKCKLEELGPVTLYEKAAMALLAIALVLWAFGPTLAQAIGWTAGKKLLNAQFVAILMGAAAFLVPIKRDRETGKLEFAMNWQKARNNISWDILVLTLGILAFGDVLTSGGVDKWMALVLKDILGEISGHWVWLICMLFCAIMSNVLSNLALISLVVPMAANLASAYGINPVAVCVSVGMVSNMAMMFPFSSLSAAAAFGGGKEYAHVRDFAGFGALMTIVVTLLTFGMFWFFGDAVFTYK